MPRRSTELAQDPGFLGEIGRSPVTLAFCLTAMVLSLVSWSSIGLDLFVFDERAFETDPWRVLTAHLVHADGFHLLSNLFWTWYFGRLLESRLGSLRFAVVLLCLAVGVNLAAHAFDRAGIGLSSIDCGFWALLVVGGRRHEALRGLIPRKIQIAWAVWILVCIGLACAGIWNMSNWEHAVGALLGASFAWTFDPALRFRHSRLVGEMVLLALLCVAATAGRERLNFGGGAEVDARAGARALERRDWELARLAYQRALRHSPLGSSELWNLAIAEDQLRRAKESQDHFFQAFELGTLDKEHRDELVDKLVWAGQVAGFSRDFGLAQLAYERALRIDPNSPRALWNLAEVQYESGRDRQKEGLENFIRAVELGTMMESRRACVVPLLTRRAIEEHDLKNERGALDYACRAAKMDPNSSAVWVMVGQYAQDFGASEWIERSKRELERLHFVAPAAKGASETAAPK
jgi:membrane associated rhomboid family serine protease